MYDLPSFLSIHPSLNLAALLHGPLLLLESSQQQFLRDPAKSPRPEADVTTHSPHNTFDDRTQSLHTREQEGEEEEALTYENSEEDDHYSASSSPPHSPADRSPSPSPHRDLSPPSSARLSPSPSPPSPSVERQAVVGRGGRGAMASGRGMMRGRGRGSGLGRGGLRGGGGRGRGRGLILQRASTVGAEPFLGPPGQPLSPKSPRSQPGKMIPKPAPKASQTPASSAASPRVLTDFPTSTDSAKPYDPADSLLPDGALPPLPDAPLTAVSRTASSPTSRPSLVNASTTLTLTRSATEVPSSSPSSLSLSQPIPNSHRNRYGGPDEHGRDGTAPEAPVSCAFLPFFHLSFCLLRVTLVSLLTIS